MCALTALNVVTVARFWISLTNKVPRPSNRRPTNGTCGAWNQSLYVLGVDLRSHPRPMGVSKINGVQHSSCSSSPGQVFSSNADTCIQKRSATPTVWCLQEEKKDPDPVGVRCCTRVTLTEWSS